MTLCHILPEWRGWVNISTFLVTHRSRIEWGRNEFMYFPWALVRSDKQTVLSWNWNRLVEFISLHEYLSIFCVLVKTLNYIWWWNPSLGIWGMWSPHFIIITLWSGVAVPVRVPSMSQIELFNHLRRIFIINY